MSTYYGSSIDSVLESMIPAAVKDGMGQKTERYIRIKEGIEKEEAFGKLKNSPQQKKLFLHLQKCSKECALHEILKDLKIGVSSANTLINKGLAIEISKTVIRDAYNDEFSDTCDFVKHDISLTDEQNQAS